MPKPMTITVQVEEAFFGQIYRKLDTTPGVVSLAYHSESAAPTKPNGHAKAPRKHETNAKDFLLSTFCKSKSRNWSLAAIREVFIAAGRAPGSVASTLYALKKDHLISLRANGTYTTTPKGRKAVK